MNFSLWLLILIAVLAVGIALLLIGVRKDWRRKP